MNGGLNTSRESERILKNEPEKLHEELKEKQKELGLRDMIPNRNQNVLQQLKDIEAEKNNIADQMQKAREAREKRTAEQRKARQFTFKQKLDMYLAQKERKEARAYESRRIVYDEFDETRIRMLPFRVLVREDKLEQTDELIVRPETMKERHPRNTVVCVGDGIDELQSGDKVLVDTYAGVEIDCGKEKYRIVFVDDILLKLEK